MPYDFTDDITNFTRIEVAPSVITWAVDCAKTLYIGDDPTNYDEDTSVVDNKLVAILASAFVGQYNVGAEFATSFKLDEFSVESNGAEDSAFSRFTSLFWQWLRMYQDRGIALQYTEASDLMDLSVYDPTIYAEEYTTPEGITE